MISDRIREDLEGRFGKIDNMDLICDNRKSKMYRMTLSGREYLLKLYPHSDSVSNTMVCPSNIKNETRAITFLNDIMPSHIPRIAHYSEESRFVLLAHGSDIVDLLDNRFRKNLATDVICEELGRTLGYVHNKTGDVGLSICEDLNEDIHQRILDQRYDIDSHNEFEGFVSRNLTPSSLALGEPSLSDIGLDDEGSLVFLELGCVHYGNPIHDIGYVCAHLMIWSNLSVQRARTFLKQFLKGYSEHSDFDSEMDDLKTSILASMLAIIDSDTNNLPSAVKSNLEDLVGNVKMTLKELPKNIQAFINSVFGTGGINYGRLDGTLVSSNQIIYHKRDESEFSINLTNRCPNSCIFCIRDFSAGWDRRTPNGDMINLYLDREPTLEEVIAAVEEELSNWDEDVSLIKLCGYGEPVLRMGLIVELAKRIRELSPNSSIQLNTSGWPLLVDYGEECLKNLRDAGIDILSISVNAPSKGVYDRIVRPGCFHYVRDAFEETLECIQLGVKNGFRVKATIVDIKPVRMYIEECRRLVEQMGAEFVVREFVGKELPGLSEEGFEVVEMETKILDIDREKIIGKLESLDATHRLTGITRLLHYDIPDDIDRRKGILELIERNIPEFRRFYSILDVIARCIRDGTNLYQRGGFLRIRNENDKEVAIIYKEPLGISNKVKKEREFYYLVESEEFAVSLLEQWQLELIRFIEKNRESYVLGGVMYDIDTWPSLGTYLEVEADDEILIFQGLSRIGISSSKAIGVHAEELFKEHRINPKRLVFTEEELRRLGTERSGSPIRD